MLEITRDENGWEWSGKPLNHSRNHIFLSGTGTPDGNTKPILRDIGNGIIRSGISRLRSGIENSKRNTTTCYHFKHLAQQNSYNRAGLKYLGALLVGSEKRKHKRDSRREFPVLIRDPWNRSGECLAWFRSRYRLFSRNFFLFSFSPRKYGIWLVYTEYGVGRYGIFPFLLSSPTHFCHFFLSHRLYFTWNLKLLKHE